ncbi:hydroxyacylglutathione hydrolase [Pelistega suis]|uniref:hydroxyacylglutathione hydrolase n=1 Tax=Pelistega suis TaxID=1631957 RepID=UPI00211BB15D|nr:hydroxyacylglutathione hydrolase [Pelistega suis]MCQ9328137.1 hydroxyacylglutathione hydrolase [Pelistega suis]
MFIHKGVAVIKVEPIPAFNDNYIWIIEDGRYACIVDPGQKDPIIDYLTKRRLQLKSILITHHHHDHTGAVLDLVELTGAHVYGPMNAIIQGIDTYVQEDDLISLAPLDLVLRVLEVPGHTLDHVAYVGEMSNGQPIAFCGDTLFSCGSGRLFEGNSTQMLQSLDKFKKMSQNTLLYCAHEYTLSNIRWALTVEPTNIDLQHWEREAVRLREQALPTVPTTLEQELKTNPFLRVGEQTVQQAAQAYAGHVLSSRAEVFSVLREWKNHF